MSANSPLRGQATVPTIPRKTPFIQKKNPRGPFHLAASQPNILKRFRLNSAAHQAETGQPFVIPSKLAKLPLGHREQQVGKISLSNEELFAMLEKPSSESPCNIRSNRFHEQNGTFLQPVQSDRSHIWDSFLSLLSLAHVNW